MKSEWGLGPDRSAKFNIPSGDELEPLSVKSADLTDDHLVRMLSRGLLFNEFGAQTVGDQRVAVFSCHVIEGSPVANLVEHLTANPDTDPDIVERFILDLRDEVDEDSFRNRWIQFF